MPELATLLHRAAGSAGTAETKLGHKVCIESLKTIYLFLINNSKYLTCRVFFIVLLSTWVVA